MALSEFEQARVERLMRAYLERHRPPPHLRGRVDLGYRLEGQTLDLFEIRADWQDPERKLEMPAARARYIKSRRRWRVYWHRASGRWEAYAPLPEVESLEDFLELVETDPYGCFFG